MLANLVLGENAFPEFLQEDCTPEKLAGALEPLLRDTPERRAQLAALARIPERMLLDGGTPERRRGRDRAATMPRTDARRADGCRRPTVVAAT